MGCFDINPWLIDCCLYGSRALVSNDNTSPIVFAFERWHTSFLARRNGIGNTPAIFVLWRQTVWGKYRNLNRFFLMLVSNPIPKRREPRVKRSFLFKYTFVIVWAVLVQSVSFPNFDTRVMAVGRFKMVDDSLVGTMSQILSIHQALLEDRKWGYQNACALESIFVDRSENESSFNNRNARYVWCRSAAVCRGCVGRNPSCFSCLTSCTNETW